MAGLVRFGLRLGTHNGGSDRIPCDYSVRSTYVNDFFAERLPCVVIDNFDLKIQRFILFVLIDSLSEIFTQSKSIS
jgi:hypothetical protein